MLETLRAASNTWLAKLLLLLLVGSFAVWGISGSISGGSGNAVMTAGGSKVTLNEFRLAYDRQLSLLSQQFGQRLTREQAQAFGIDNQVMAQLAAGVVLDEEARTLDLGISEDRIAKLVAEEPAFHGADGRFDRLVFTSVLRNAGMSEEDYLVNQEQVAKRQQIIEAVSDGLAAPEVMVRAAALHAGETRTISYISVPETVAGDVAAPTDAELTAWFEENRNEYRAPEYRKITYARLEAGDIADPAAITDEQARADYEKRKDRYTTPERRTIEQIVFATTEEAENARAQILSGQTFESVLEAQGKSIADAQLGTVSRNAVTDTAIADAAFALNAGEISKVVDGTFGKILLRVTAIEPEVVRDFASVEADIRKELALDEANRIIFDVHDAVEDDLGGGMTLAEVADKHRLKLVTIDAIDATARRPDGSVVSDIPASAELLGEAFKTEVNVENLPVSLGSGGFAWYNVEEITQSRDRTLDEVRDQVVAAWTEEAKSSALSAKAEELRKRLADGATLDQIATELGLSVEIKRGLTRSTESDPVFGPEAVSAAFAGGTGHIAQAPAASGPSRLLLRVDEIIEPLNASADAVSDAEKRRLAGRISDDLLDQFVARLQGTYPVEVNQSAVNQALSF